MDILSREDVDRDHEQQPMDLPPLEEGMVLAKPDYFMTPTDDKFGSAPGLEYFEYWTTKIGELTGGRLGATMLRATPAAAEHEGSPWHYHRYDISMSIVLKGTAVFEFEGVGQVKFEPGMVIYQPEKNRHREISMSPDFQAIEINMPATVDTHIMVPEADTGEWSEFVVTV